MSNLSINNSKVDLFYKLVDKACMVYYNELGIDYLEAFIKVSESLTRDFDEMKLSKKAIDKLNAIYEEISNTEFLNEEVRLACELVFVKGLKHRNVLLDFMTPDVINYLFVHIIKSILDNVEGFDKSEITILDTVLGTSNLLQTIINNVENYKDINILGVGIEKDELLVHLSQAFSELLGNEIVINFNDALKKINSCANIIVGDFGETKDVYQIIEERLNNLADDGFFIFVINNDFFTYASDDFRKVVSSQATLIGLIMLPQIFTNASHVGKSILIGRKGNLSDYQMAIVKMEDDLSQESLEMTFVKIYNMFKEIGGKKMRKIMAVNAGSSSLKFQLLEMPAEKVIVSGIVERIKTDQGAYSFKVDGKKVIDRKGLPIENHAQAVQLVLDGLLELKLVESLEEISGVGHRVVQGGAYFSDSCVVTPDVKAKIEELADLAPLHNPAHLVGINAFEKVLPNVQNVVVFDTSFHQTMPKEAYLYGTPMSWYRDYKVRKYGAHGTSHKYVAHEVAKLMGKPIEDLKIVTCHLGNGASLAAVKDGKCLDTTMGLTPLDGIPMGTRSGHMDPTVLSYMQTQTGWELKDIIKKLNNESGYLGMSEYSHDSRDLDDAVVAASKPDATEEEKELGARCKIALDVQYKRIADYIGGYYIYMKGIDVIVFTAGIGENCAYLRDQLCQRLSVLGIEIDNELNYDNSIRGKVIKLSTDNSKVAVYILPTNEELVIARDVMRLTK